MEKEKLQTETIEIASGTAAGFFDFEFEPRKDYEKINFIEIIPINNGGDEDVLIGLFDKNGEVVPLVPLKIWGHRGGGYYGGLRKFNLKSEDLKYRFRLQTQKTLTAKLNFKAVLTLKREEGV